MRGVEEMSVCSEWKYLHSSFIEPVTPSAELVTCKASPSRKRLAFLVQTGQPLSGNPQDNLFAPLRMLSLLLLRECSYYGLNTTFVGLCNQYNRLNAKKCWLIVKPWRENAAKEVFGDTAITSLSKVTSISEQSWDLGLSWKNTFERRSRTGYNKLFSLQSSPYRNPRRATLPWLLVYVTAGRTL